MNLRKDRQPRPLEIADLPQGIYLYALTGLRTPKPKPSAWEATFSFPKSPACYICLAIPGLVSLQNVKCLNGTVDSYPGGLLNKIYTAPPRGSTREKMGDSTLANPTQWNPVFNLSVCCELELRVQAPSTSISKMAGMAGN